MIAVLTDPTVGGTFLSWTIEYLSGKTQYFSVRNQANIDLPNDPMTEKNAHKFKVNRVRKFEECVELLSMLQKSDQKECIYLHTLRQDTKPAVDAICQQAEKIIVLTTPPIYTLYTCSYNNRTESQPAFCSEKELTDPEEILSDFIYYFFKDSKQRWDSNRLTQIWDQREFIALNFRPLQQQDNILTHMNAQKCHIITTPDMYTNFENSVRELFDYIEITIDESRFPHWVTVYNKWKKIHNQRTKFIWYFDTIVQGILKGTDFDLTCFNLDIKQEAAIQHALIYQHGLNFKTWQLIQFTNTKQLHDLLEPNMHQLED